MPEPRKVHVRNAAGVLLYNKLLDDGSNILRFHDGFGFVERATVIRKAWGIYSGWIEPQDFNQEDYRGNPYA